MTDPIAIRPYRTEDAAALAALFRDTLQRVNSADYDAPQLAAWAAAADDLAAWSCRFVGRDTFVASSGAGPLGFAELAPDGTIDRFYVHADHQGKGIGSRLLQALEAAAAKAGLAAIHAHVSVTAEPFFARHGFVIVRRQSVSRAGVTLANALMAKPLVE